MALSSASYVALLLLGAANLVPWMTYLTLADYFYGLYGTNAMEFYFPAISTTALVLTSAVLLVVGPRFSFNARIAWPTFYMALMLLVVPAMDLAVASGYVSRHSAFALTVGSTCLNAVCSASAQNSLYALGSLLGDSATPALQTGNGVIGLVAVCLRVLSKLGLPPTPAMWSFCVCGALILLLSLFAYMVLMADPHVKGRVNAHERRRIARQDSPDTPEHDSPSRTLSDPMLEAEYERGEGQWGSLDYQKCGAARRHQLRPLAYAHHPRCHVRPKKHSTPLYSGTRSRRRQHRATRRRPHSRHSQPPRWSRSRSLPSSSRASRRSQASPPRSHRRAGTLDPGSPSCSSLRTTPPTSSARRCPRTSGSSRL